MSYEFDNDTCTVLRRFALVSVILGVSIIILNGLDALGASFDPDASQIVGTRIFNSALRTIMGVAWLIPALDFKRLATTEGDDINELMKGIDKQNLCFKIIAILFVVVIIVQLLVIGGVLA